MRYSIQSCQSMKFPLKMTMKRTLRKSNSPDVLKTANLSSYQSSVLRIIEKRRKKTHSARSLMKSEITHTDKNKICSESMTRSKNWLTCRIERTNYSKNRLQRKNGRSEGSRWRWLKLTLGVIMNLKMRQVSILVSVLFRVLNRERGHRLKLALQQQNHSHKLMQKI